MYGTRARIGYTCPVFLAEIFPYDFYKMVPEGVTLVTATASVWEGTPEELKRMIEKLILLSECEVSAKLVRLLAGP